jgi:hypothetical protein
MSNKNEPLSRDRREVVRKGGAAAFGAIAAWLTARVSPVRAEALAQVAPVIDRLTLSVVIDSYQIRARQERDAVAGWTLTGSNQADVG